MHATMFPWVFLFRRNHCCRAHRGVNTFVCTFIGSTIDDHGGRVRVSRRRLGWLVMCIALAIAANACDEETKNKAKKKLKKVLDDHKKKQAKKRADAAAKKLADEAKRRSEQALRAPTGPKVPGSGFKLGSELQIARVRIQIAGDKSYDDDSVADPKVDIRVDGVSVGKCRQDETTSLVCKLRWATFEVRAETEISLVVVDDDLMRDDKIGTAALAHLTKQGALDTPLPMRVTGGITKATVVLTKAPRVSKTRTRIYGGIAGVVFALLLLLLFHRYLFDEDRYLVGKELAPKLAKRSQQPEPSSDVAIKVRCPYCSALNDESAAECIDCGGKL